MNGWKKTRKKKYINILPIEYIRKLYVHAKCVNEEYETKPIECQRHIRTCYQRSEDNNINFVFWFFYFSS